MIAVGEFRLVCNEMRSKIKNFCEEVWEYEIADVAVCL